MGTEGVTCGRPGGGEAGLLARTLAGMTAGRRNAFGQCRTVQNYGTATGQCWRTPRYCTPVNNTHQAKWSEDLSTVVDDIECERTASGYTSDTFNPESLPLLRLFGLVISPHVIAPSTGFQSYPEH